MCSQYSALLARYPYMYQATCALEIWTCGGMYFIMLFDTRTTWIDTADEG